MLSKKSSPAGSDGDRFAALRAGPPAGLPDFSSDPIYREVQSMKMIKTTIVAAGVAGLLLGTADASADGAALFTSKLCVTCHGAEGKAPIAPNYPRLAGQNDAYCQEQTKDIRDGKRTNGMTAVMRPIVASVTDAELAELCQYISSVK
jgi:cytochrome c